MLRPIYRYYFIFYFILLLLITTLFYFIDLYMHRCYNAEVTFLHLFIEIQMLITYYDVMFTLFLYLLDLPVLRWYSAEAVIYLFSIPEWNATFYHWVWQVILCNIPVQSRIVHSHVRGLLDCSCHIVALPAYDHEIFHRGVASVRAINTALNPPRIWRTCG